MVILEAGRKSRPCEYYPTPPDVALSALWLATVEPRLILDPGCAGGTWGEAALKIWPKARVWGVELRAVQPHPAYSAWITSDYLQWDTRHRFSLICGNPPYSLFDPWIRKSFELLVPGGEVVFLLPLRYLEGQKRGEGLWRDHPPAEVAVCSKRPSFTQDGKANATAFAVYLWRDGHEGPTTLTWI